MRAGIDYVNNRKRYDRAYKLLTRAFDDAQSDDAVSAIDRAKLCLWIGITLNENMDIKPPVKRNDDAIVWYKRGLRFIQHTRSDPDALLVRASLYNSLGVAYHHRFTRWNGGPIPALSFRYYNKATDIATRHNDIQGMLLIKRQVDRNTGNPVNDGGGSGLCSNLVV